MSSANFLAPLQERTTFAAELHQAVEPAFRAIATRLRELGHNVTEAPTELDPEFSAWSYEYREGDGWTDLAFRIWLQTQVGVVCGYLEESGESEDHA